MAESISLAILENLVHLTKEDFPEGYVIVSATIPDVIKILTDSRFRKRARGTSMQKIGDAWLISKESTVLKVQSVVNPDEFNYLLNPRHPHFSRIVFDSPRPFAFDPRLFPGSR